jgi:uncharacterized membrane protein YgcG
MPRRTPETLADYLIVAICPALIMFLVGSLLFFLVHVFYQGQFTARLLFVMAMFVMAIVCIARIAMEEGRAYATLYAFPIAILVGLALARFVQIQGPLAIYSGPINWTLMAIVWAAAHKLTWDCTLMDDSQDASGQGLLQQMGMASDHPDSPQQSAASPAAPSEAAVPEATTPLHPIAARHLAWWQSWLEPDRRPHPPGVWVIVFSLAALPLFGIGGRFIPEGDLELRRRCFWLLVVYVASGMALLLATSFLGLRRYLRQRRLEMPAEMAAVWVGAGVVLIAATLVVASLVPRPSPEYSLAHLVDVDSLDRKASRYAFGPEGGKDDPNNPSRSGAEQQEDQQAEQEGGGKQEKGTGDRGQESGDRSQGSGDRGQGKQGGGNSKSKSKGTQSSGDNSKQGDDSKGQSGEDGKAQTQSASKSGDQQQGSTGEQQQPKSEQPASDDQGNNGSSRQEYSEQQQSSSSSQSSGSSPVDRVLQQTERLFGSLGGLLKAIFYLAIAIIAAVIAWKYRTQLLAAWRKLLAELADLWARWFGGPKPAVTEPVEAAPAPRPFAQFADPFASGHAERMSPAEIVRYTFLALEAWGRENGCPRPEGQTPHEFAAAIGQLDASLMREAAHLAELYSRMAYAPPAAIRTTFDPLRSLWQKMQAPALTVV